MKTAAVTPMKSRRHDDEDVWQADVVWLDTWVERKGRAPIRPVIGLVLSTRNQKIGGCGPDALERDPSARIVEALDALAAEVGAWPAAIELRSVALAAAVRAKVAEHKVRVEVVTDLPALDDAVNLMVEELNLALEKGEVNLDSGAPPLQSAPGMTTAAIAGFAAAAAEFYAAAPWRIFGADDIIHIEAPRPDPSVGYVSVVATEDVGFGIVALDSEDGWEGMDEIGVDAYLHDHSGWLILAADPAEVPFAEFDLWEDLALPTVMGEQIPFVVRYGPKRRIRRPSPRMLAFFAGLLRAIAATTEEDANTGRWRKTVETTQGQMAFTLALPAVLDVLSEDVDSRMLPIPLLQERAHRRIEQVLSERKFASLEEVNQYLASNMDGFDLRAAQAVTLQEQAEELALRAANEIGRAAMALARKALALWPDCADAYVTLGEQSRDADAALGFFEQGVAAGERALGEEAFTEYAGNFWVEHETRPYMRARFALARHLWAVGRTREAVAHYRELLRLNPNDNQGVRELIVPGMIAIGDDAGAEEVLAHYPDDGLSSTFYNRALLAFRRHGDRERTRKLLAAAIEWNPHVPPYLLEEIDLLAALPETIEFRGEDEAAAYVADSMEAWQSSPGALDWLRAKRQSAQKPGRKSVSVGGRSTRSSTSKKKPASPDTKPPTKRRSKG